MIGIPESELSRAQADVEPRLSSLYIYIYVYQFNYIKKLAIPNKYIYVYIYKNALNLNR